MVRIIDESFVIGGNTKTSGAVDIFRGDKSYISSRFPRGELQRHGKVSGVTKCSISVFRRDDGYCVYVSKRSWKSVKYWILGTYYRLVPGTIIWDRCTNRSRTRRTASKLNAGIPFTETPERSCIWLQDGDPGNRSPDQSNRFQQIGLDGIPPKYTWSFKTLGRARMVTCMPNGSEQP